MSLYATIPLLHGDKEFERGDLLSRDYTPEQLAKLVEWGQASAERPADVTPVYALETFHYHVHTFRPGDRVDSVVPAAVWRQWIEHGHARLGEPAKPSRTR
jgi:hypothetical protein